MRHRPRTSRFARFAAHFVASSACVPVWITLALIVVTGCGKDKVLQPNRSQSISTPSSPVGPATAMQGDFAGYTTGGAVSSAGDTLEYRFDFDAAGAHGYSAWSRDSTTSVDWYVPGTFVIKAQARSAAHPSAVSAWSGGLTVTILPSEAVTVPNQPSGASVATRGDGVAYTSGGSTSSKGHTVEYRFQVHEVSRVVPDATSPWGPSPTLNRTWDVAGLYSITAQARCATDTLVASEWSSALAVTVNPTGTPVVLSGYLVLVSSTTDEVPLVLRQASGAWDEQTVTWGTMPSLSDSLAESSYTTECIFDFCSSAAQFPVGAALLQGWLEHSVTNDGLAVGPGALASSDIAFVDRTSYVFQPYLRVDWRYDDETVPRTKLISMSQDSYVDETQPGSNFGSGGILVAGRSGGGSQVILVRADLTLP